MATKQKPKKKITTVEEEVIDEVKEPDEIIPPDPEEVELYQYLESLGDGAITVKVSEEVPGGLRFAFTATRKEEATEEAIQGRFPLGGTFVLKIMKDGQVRGVRRLLIGPAQGVTSNGNGGSNDLRFMMEQIQQLRSEIRGGGQRIEQGTFGEIAQVIKALQPPPPPPQPDSLAQMGTMMGIMKTMAEFVKESVGGAADTPWWKDLAMAAAPAIAPALGGLLRAGAPQPNGNHALPEAPPANPAELTEEQQVQLQEQQVTELLKAGIAFLKPKALSMHPDSAISLVISAAEMGDARASAVIYGCQSREFGAIASLDADIGREPYIGFFRAVYDELHGFRSDDSASDSMDGDSSGPAGNPGNARNDGKTKSKGGK